MACEKDSSRGEHVPESVYEASLGWLVEIYHYISAEDEIQGGFDWPVFHEV